MKNADLKSAENTEAPVKLKNALLLDDDEFVKLLLDEKCGGIIEWCYAGDIDRAFDFLERMDPNGGNSITTTKESRMKNYRYCQCDVEFPEIIGDPR